MKARISASVLAVGLVFGLAGCGMMTPVATNIHYDASDGVSATQGDLALRNIMVITTDDASRGSDGKLVFTAVNAGKSDAKVTLQYEIAGSKKTVAVDVRAGETLALGVGDAEPITLSGLGAPAGSMISLYVQSGDSEGQLINVPVLNTTLSEYQHLAG